MRLLDGTILGSNIFANGRIGPGGFVTGMTQDLLGTTRTVHMDTFGARVWRPGDTEWRQLFTASFLGSLATDADPSTYSGPGVYAAAVAPSDGTKGYVVALGTVYYTSDNWLTSTKRGLTSKLGLANTQNPNRLKNDKIAVDPQNPLVAVIGFEGTSGAYWSNDGFATYAKITGIADPVDRSGHAQPILVACDPTSGLAGGAKLIWFLGVEGTGVYRSTDGPDGPYTSIGGPTHFQHMVCDDWGDLFVCTGEAGDYLKKYSAGAWSDETGPGARDDGWASYAFNPANRNQRAVFSPNGFNDFTNGADAWQGTRFNGYPGNNAYTVPANGPSWLAGTNTPLFPSKVLWSRADTSKVMMAHGTGTCKGPVPAGNWTWTDDSRGIEQLVSNQGVYSAGKYFLCCWDKGWFQTSDISVYPGSHYPQGVGFTAGWSVDADGPNIVQLVTWSGSNDSQVSNDGGGTYRGMAMHPDGAMPQGGCIAIQGANDILWVPSNNGRAVWSDDGGASWNLVDCGGLLPASGVESGWSYAYYFAKRNAVASKITPGKFYLWNYGAPSAPGTQGFWRSTTGPGGPWTRVFHGAPQDNGAGAAPGHWSYHMELNEVPGHAGYLLISAGGDQAVPLCRSIDDGVNWAPVSTKVGGISYQIMNCARYGFGKGPSRSRYPAIRYWATVNGVEGLYETLDNFVTSMFLTANVDGWLVGGPKHLTGSMDKFGEWLYGFDGSGYKTSKHKHQLILS